MKNYHLILIDDDGQPAPAVQHRPSRYRNCNYCGEVYKCNSCLSKWCGGCKIKIKNQLARRCYLKSRHQL